MGFRHAPPRLAPLLLAVLLVRALLPTGWMPVAQDGRMVWQLCPNFVATVEPSPTMAVMAEHGDHDPHAEHRGETARDSCPFGALTGAGADIPNSPTVADRLPFVQPSILVLEAVSLRQQRWLAHALARGPPATA